MKKNIIITVIVFLFTLGVVHTTPNTLASVQWGNEFCEGYYRGYKDGDKERRNCPLCPDVFPPACPPMRPQDTNTWSSGYKRGFADGMRGK